MIKRTIEISREPAHLAVHLDQLLIQHYPQPGDAPDAPRKQASIPCEDIGLVMIDHPRTTYSHHALSSLMRFGAAVVVCGTDHLPAGIMLPMSSHTEIVWRVQEQIDASQPTRKKLWQQIIMAKIKAQALALPDGSPTRDFLLELAKEVKSGDTTNVEAHAAKLYWSAWLDPTGTGRMISSLTAEQGSINVLDPTASCEPNEPSKIFPTFRGRDADGLDSVNIMLNYGYAILRAAVGRALVSAGLFPALGLHHRHRSNAFALADDIMEPLRPMIDVRVRDLHKQHRDQLDQPTKAYLLAVLQDPVSFSMSDDPITGPLLVVLHRYTAALIRCLQDQKMKLTIPIAVHA